MLLAMLFIWLGCLLTFLSSSHQSLTNKRLQPHLSWSVFVVVIFSSWYLFNQEYSVVISGLMVLTFVIVTWLAIVLAQGRINMKLLTFFCSGVVVMSLLAFLGAI